MNKKDLAIQRNNRSRLLEPTSRRHRNCVRISVANSLEHEIKKLRLCYAFKKANQEFVCEAVFLKGGRADIFNLSNGNAYEIISSESEESLVAKEHAYPVPIIKVYI